MNPVPPKLKRKLDREYGTVGWTYVGHDENLYIDIRTARGVISFNMWHYM